MSEIKITEENLKKAHEKAKNGCPIAEVLEQLAPKVFGRSYPYYGIYRESGAIVYFTGKGKGYVIKSEINPVGIFHKKWDESIFEPTKGIKEIE